MAKLNLLEINPCDYDERILTNAELLGWLEHENAYWALEGEPSPERPHAELTQGACSDGYFDMPRILCHPNIAEIVGRQLGMKLRAVGITKVDWVVSSAYSAITFGHEVAKELGARFGHVEKDLTDPKQRRMVWQKLTIPAGSSVIQAEELSTTLGTPREVRRAIIEGNRDVEGNPVPVEFLDIIGLGIHRPPHLPISYDDYHVVALLEKEIRTYPKREECPYCQVGSLRYRPKTHWAELTRRG